MTVWRHIKRTKWKVQHKQQKFCNKVLYWPMRRCYQGTSEQTRALSLTTAWSAERCSELVLPNPLAFSYPYIKHKHRCTVILSSSDHHQQARIHHYNYSIHTTMFQVQITVSFDWHQSVTYKMKETDKP